VWTGLLGRPWIASSEGKRARGLKVVTGLYVYALVYPASVEYGENRESMMVVNRSFIRCIIYKIEIALSHYQLAR
jgi:hypothetical protein